MFTAALSTLFVGLAAAVAIPRQVTITHDTPDYYLKTAVTAGNASYDGQYIQMFHTAAGESATVLTLSETDGVLGFLSGTQQTFEPNLPYTFVLENSTTSYGPAGYNYLAINVGEGTTGFSINNATNEIVFSGFPGFASFAACYVAGIAPYTSVGPEVEVLWRTNATVIDPACADIDLYAVWA